MKQFLLKSVLFSFIFFGFGIVAFFIIKARSTSSSTTDWSPTNIYASVGDSLSAAKRNTLVNKVNSGVNINDCVLSQADATVTANARLAKSLTCPWDHPHLILGNCSWDRDPSGSLFRGRYDTTDLNKRTCMFYDTQVRTTTSAIQIKCCKWL